jgi:hypothetical protein
MVTIERRVKRLEDVFVPPDGPFLVVVPCVAQRLALDQDACVDSIRPPERSSSTWIRVAE